jgi:hypothetical protein
MCSFNADAEWTDDMTPRIGCHSAHAPASNHHGRDFLFVQEQKALNVRQIAYYANIHNA